MKIKRLQFIVCVITLALFQLSCSSDSDDVVYDENNPHPNAESSLIGTWVLESDKSITQTFKWDGTIIYSNGKIKNYNVKNPDLAKSLRAPARSLGRPCRPKPFQGLRTSEGFAKCKTLRKASRAKDIVSNTTVTFR